MASIEYVIDGGFNDILVGSSAANRLENAIGNDLIFADVGSDMLLGGEGNDVLSGGKGSDVLTGCTGAMHFVSNSGLVVRTLLRFPTSP